MNIGIRCKSVFAGLYGLTFGSFVEASQFDISVFYPANQGIDSMLQATVASVSSPDFDVAYSPVEESIWQDSSDLANFLVASQESSPADGFLLACKNTDLDAISNLFRSKFPKVPFVDSFGPALMAANIVSYRYVVFTGSESGELRVRQLVQDMGVEDHIRDAALDTYMIQMESLGLTAKKDTVIPGIVSIGDLVTNSHRTDFPVINAESIALAGCEGFLDAGVATEAQKQLADSDPPIPMQVINPIRASMGLLYSMIRNKVWISIPRKSDAPEQTTDDSTEQTP